jgi:hypothetical protein
MSASCGESDGAAAFVVVKQTRTRTRTRHVKIDRVKDILSTGRDMMSMILHRPGGIELYDLNAY